MNDLPVSPPPAAEGLSVHAPAAPTADRAPVLNFFLDALIALVILLLVSIAAGMAWGVLRGFQLVFEARARGVEIDPSQVAHQLGQPGAMAQLLMALVSTGTAALVVYFWRRRASRAERQQSWAALRVPRTWGLASLVAVGVFCFSTATGMLAERLDIKPVPTNLSLMSDLLAQWPWSAVVFAVLLAPAYEELLFRRVLFGRLLAAGRPVLGIVLSSVAFALLHEIPGLSGNGVLAICQLWLVYGSMGAAFAWLYWRTGSLWAAIFAHGLNNAIAIAALYWFGLQ
ncbi:CPBP family intramembrane metalloprotease [Stenotrophomonas sp. HITSZ_GD]|uniref:CPBP family intramembrane glutamic endopeptidase n=1 Tax=Stenotrophomonas sp. HITSZ_GD TaxID=3037248 RepID=UPI00240E1FC6|nr:CPBP family intramembrane glutamic endopeptidase [Stenotrophomonas sp. HITSZ_GD]MDG2524068.1 CPBP family intramembrane metalloprotease [Stenotrophomonas sp. HITSZ_GD]